MNITGSPDITYLEALVTWDISGILPVITVVNQSAGPNIANVVFWIVATSPSGTPIHEGSFSQPDATGVSTITLVDPWPRPFSSIEFSGAQYTATLYAQDSTGAIYQIDKSVSIIRPFGNTNESKNSYGLACTNVQVICQQARVYFEDTTLASYKGITGTQTSSILKVIYPLDPTYAIPAPFQIANFSNAMVPISYSSDNYQFLAAHIYDYNFGNNTHVVIKYQEIKTFSVLCNIDLMPLICEYQKLIDGIENGTCVNVQESIQKLTLINPKFALVMMGIAQPLTGINVPELIEEIKRIGGFTCDCLNAPSGIIPQTASVIDGYTFQIASTCGDISGNVTKEGTQIILNLSDKSYVFNIGSQTGTTAFSVVPATSGCIKTYSLNINPTQLATDILTIISTNAGLVNMFNSINTNSSMKLLLDGGCIFSTGATCDYTFGLVNIPVNTTFAILSGIRVGAINRMLNFSFNQTNLPALQAYLNGLGIGTFVVANGIGGAISITSAANPSDIQSLTYTVTGTSNLASFSKNCTGFVPVDAQTAVQNIINYLCGITDAQIATSQDYTITYVDSTGATKTINVPAGTNLSDLISQIISYNTQTISNQKTGAVTCDGMNAVFTANQNPIGANDYFFATKNGACSRVSFSDALFYMVSNMTSTVKAAFCAAVVSCGAGLSCEPYNYINVLISPYDTSCVSIVGIEYGTS